MIDLAKLEEDARRATQGEWRIGTENLYTAEIIADVRDRRFYIADTIAGLGEFGLFNAYHIANSSPSTILAFVAAVKAAIKHLDELPLGTILPAEADLREALKPFRKE